MIGVINQAKIIERIKNIPDPEIPVISIADLGILRDIVFTGDKAEVIITPTYSGCPAMKVIEDEIKEVMREEGVADVKVKLAYSPVWTTDWLSEDAKERLRAYGISPPEKTSSDKNLLAVHKKEIKCPRCGSVKTIMVSPFGSTACKALYKCENCLEPFDYFKCH